MVKAKHREAGRYLKQLRIAAGYPSRDSFVRLCGDRASFDRIASLETGSVDPKARDLKLYFEITGCDPLALLQIPV